MQPIDLPQSLISPHDCLPGAGPQHYVGQGKIGVLLLHGLTGSPAELAPLAERLRRAEVSFAAPVLAGHATTVQALAVTTWRDWRTSAQQAHHWLGQHFDTVHIVGFSMGALLATLLAAEQEPRQRGKVALLAPAFALRPLEQRALRWLARAGLLPVLPGRRDGVGEPRYRSMPLRSVVQLIELQQVVCERVQPLPHPVLAMHGDDDWTIDPGHALPMLRQVLGPAPQLRLVRGGEHLLLLGQHAPAVTAAIIEFLAT